MNFKTVNSQKQDEWCQSGLYFFFWIYLCFGKINDGCLELHNTTKPHFSNRDKILYICVYIYSFSKKSTLHFQWDNYLLLYDIYLNIDRYFSPSNESPFGWWQRWSWISTYMFLAFKFYSASEREIPKPYINLFCFWVLKRYIKEL